MDTFGAARLVSQTMRLVVRVSELPAPRSDDQFWPYPPGHVCFREDALDRGMVNTQLPGNGMHTPLLDEVIAQNLSLQRLVDPVSSRLPCDG